MDDALKESLAGFESLWQRVSCRADRPAEPEPAAAYSPEDTLPGLIHDETCAEVWARSLARVLRNGGQTALQRHAAEAKRHLRRLRAEYFIATGMTGGAGGDCRAPGDTLSCLRAMLLQAENMAERYERAAAQTDSPELREMFAAFAADERRRARELRCLVIGSF